MSTRRDKPNTTSWALSLLTWIYGHGCECSMLEDHYGPAPFMNAAC